MSAELKLTQDILHDAIMGLPLRQRTQKRIQRELEKRFGLKVSASTIYRSMRDWGITRDLGEQTRATQRDIVAKAFAEEKVAELTSGIETLNQADSLVQTLIDKARDTLAGITQDTAGLADVTRMVTAIEKLMLAGAQVRLTMADIRTKLPDQKPPPEPREFVGDNVVDAAAEFRKFGGQA
jgi:hypothetical protein